MDHELRAVIRPDERWCQVKSCPAAVKLAGRRQARWPVG